MIERRSRRRLTKMRLTQLPYDVRKFLEGMVNDEVNAATCERGDLVAWHETDARTAAELLEKYESGHHSPLE